MSSMGPISNDVWLGLIEGDMPRADRICQAVSLLSSVRAEWLAQDEPEPERSRIPLKTLDKLIEICEERALLEANPDATEADFAANQKKNVQVRYEMQWLTAWLRMTDDEREEVLLSLTQETCM